MDRTGELINSLAGDPPASDGAFIFPASFAQQRLWFLDKLEPGQNTYNVPFAIRFKGDLKFGILEQVLQELINRHEILRTTFSEDDSGEPIQVVASESLFRLPAFDLRSFPTESREVEARRRVIEHVRRPFDLKRGPLFGAHLFRLGDADYVLSLVFHHTIVDGWSWGVLFRELSTLYEAFSQGKPSPLAPLPIQYGDYATWQRDRLQGETLVNLLSYWKKQLAEASLVLDLPGDSPRPVIQTFNGAQEAMVIPRHLHAALTELSQKEGVTLFMTLLTAFNLLLARYSGQEDIIVGTPISGRTRAELETLIGFFVNTLPLRTDVSGNPTFRELLARVRETALQGYAHQELPFERLVEELSPERDVSRSPIVQVLYIFEQSTQEHRRHIADLEISSFRGAEGTTAKFDMQFSALVNSEGLRLALTYNVDLFRSATVNRMLSHLGTILEAMVANPDARTGTLSLLSDTERQQLLCDLNSTGKEYRRDTCVHQMVEEQVDRTPEAVAISFENEQLTYLQLNERSNQLARYLRTIGIGPGSLVAICMDRSVEMVVSVLATLKSGGAYVPLDPEYPKDRLAFMLEDSQAAVVLTQERLRSGLQFGSTKVLCVDSASGDIAGQSAENPKSLTSPEDLVYVIYTSGSTGKPKGVCLPHRCLTNLLYWQMETSRAGMGDRTLQFTSLSFDVSFQEIFSTLTTGGSLILISDATRRDGRALLRYLKQHSVARLFQPFVALQQIAEEAHEEQELPTSLREVITAGEQLKITPQIASLFERLPECKLFNHYGPSETHVVTSYELSGSPVGWKALPSIGKPIANTQVYILDSNRNPVPQGVSGELYIGGISLAKGYLRRPDLTQERFVPSPFSKDSTDLLYRTGDLCRYLPESNIQYLGRIDNQIKFRGYRIELGEIENALGKNPAVQQAAVILREDNPGDKRLVAYVVGRSGSLNPAELRAYLKQIVPDYMVPSAFVELETLPLTPSGKVNRRKLPAPEWETATSSKEPALQNPLEELLVGVWTEVLRRKGFGVQDNFFDLGGHSLLATQLISRIRRIFGVDLPLRLVFERPTIRELAQDVDRARRDSEMDTSPRLLGRSRRADANEETAFPLSFAEQRLWMLSHLDRNSSVYNLSVGLRFQGSLDIQALEQSLTEILRRHEVLRARFHLNGENPQQVIGPAQRVSLPIKDVSGRKSPEVAARDLVREESQKPFNLATGPLWRASLVKVATNDHVLLISFHHAVFDGWSRGVLLRELSAYYTTFTTGASLHLPEPEIQYTDFAIWQREYLSGERLQRQVNYWKRQLEGAPSYLDLPTDRLRPQLQTFHGSQLTLTIPVELTRELRKVTQESHATLFMTLLGAFGILLSRYSNQEDVVIGSPIAGRTHAETENLIGFFVNTIPLRTSIAGNPTFKQLLAAVRGVTLDAYSHQDLPFEKLVEELKPERDLSRNPIFQAMFALQNVPRENIEFSGLNSSPFGAGGAPNSKFDLSLMAVEKDDSVTAVFEYNTDLFDQTTIQRMAAHFHVLLEAIVASPEARVSELPLMNGAERQQVLSDWNAGRIEVPEGQCLHHLFEAQADRTPKALAVEAGKHKISYGELNERANQIAHRLIKLGAGPEVLVGVFLERSEHLLPAILGILKTGAAYVPLDPNYPQDRIATILEDSKAELVVTQKSLAGHLRAMGNEAVLLDVDSDTILCESRENPGTVVKPENLAYVLFTSGSTGRPKGVALEHRSAVVFVHWAKTVFSPQELERVLFSTSVCFDLSIFEMFSPLSVGGSVIVVQNALSLSSADAPKHVTFINTVPSAMAELLRAGAVPASAQTVNLAGEALGRDLVDEIYRTTKIKKLYNLYGPTEDTTYSTYTLTKPHTRVTIGKPLPNTQAYVLDRYGNAQPVGIPGELYLAGAGLARGYYGRPDLTAERFVKNPFSSDSTARMYKTSDLCRWLPSGELEYLGRLDHQVKIRGFRIELGEIESMLSKHPAIQQAVVVAREDSPGNKRLVAYIIPASGQHLNTVDARGYLKTSLPDYMLPSAVVELDAFPLTPNGKVDRKALPKPEFSPAATPVAIPPRDEIETRLAAIWQQVLGVPSVNITDNFFDLGGHSLLAVRMVSEIKNLTGVEVPLTALFQGATIERLADLVRGNVEIPPAVTHQIQAGGNRPPFFAAVLAGMNSLGYVPLAKHLGPDLPFYTLQSPGPGPRAKGRPYTAKEYEVVASEYVRAMRSVQPVGPYYIGGTCEGARIAFEMTRILEAAGESVALLAVIDTWVLENTQNRALWRLYYYYDQMRRMLRQPWKTQMATVRKAVRNRVQWWTKASSAPPKSEWIKAYWPGEDFLPTQIRGRITVFKIPRQPFYYHSDPLLGWGPKTKSGVSIETVRHGKHTFLLREPYVRELAASMANALAKIQSAPTTISLPLSSEHDSVDAPALSH